jgi:hypothetical protein
LLDGADLLFKEVSCTFQPIITGVFEMYLRLSLALSLIPIAVHANDTVATVASSEIIYEKSKDIIMEKEVLKISKDQVDVAYEFRNPTEKDITVDVAFPLPPFENPNPTWDQDYIARTFLEENPAGRKDGVHSSQSLYNFVNDTPFLNFKRYSDGSLYGYNTRITATMPDGKDITEFLRKNDIPLSTLLIMGNMESGWIHDKPEFAKKLKKLKLLDKEGKPLWTTQTVFYWQDTFPASKVHKVQHTYKPATGLNWIEADTTVGVDSFDQLKLNNKNRKWSDYCLDDSMKSEVLGLFKAMSKNKVAVLRLYEIAYVLKTGANWNGPIRDFRLEITPPDNTLVSFCPVGDVKPVKTPDGKYVVEIKNFTPKEDLRVLFVEKSMLGQ